MIKQEAYDFLQSIKGEMSFSEIILSFKKKGTLADFAGKYKYSKNEAEIRKAQIQVGRKQADDRIRHLRNH
jgi:predicted CopG family antitoxin